MSTTSASRTGTPVRHETAPEYGRLEHCFQDHHKAPFCLDHHLAQIHSTRQETDSDGLIRQSGLRIMSLPQPRITIDSLNDTDNNYLDLVNSPDISAAVPPLLPGSNAFKEVRLSLHDLDLGPDSAVDVQVYLKEVEAKQHCNILDQWLPLCPVRAEKDEALSFPPHCSRLQSLLLREIQRESISSSKHAAWLQRSPVPGTEASLMAGSRAKPRFLSLAEPVTPPLSPVSNDVDSPFVPDSTVTFIDLTSEPSSPINPEFETLKIKLQSGTLDSDPPQPSSTPTASPTSLELARPRRVPERSQDLKVDMPLVMTSSDTASDGDFFASTDMLPIVDMEDLLESSNIHDTHFEDALQAIIEVGQTDPTKLIEQERLNPSDSIARVPVPILDFDITIPDWAAHARSPRALFLWLSHRKEEFPKAQDAIWSSQSASALRWTPVPPRAGRMSLVEEFPRLSTASRQLLAVDDAPSLSSSNCVTTRSVMAVLLYIDNDEIESMAEESSPSAGSGYQVFTNPSSATDHGHRILTDADLTEGRDVSRRRYLDESACVLPRLNDPSATTKLLSGFMELRAAKRPRLSSPKRSKPESSSQPQRTHQRPLSPEISRSRESQTNIHGLKPASVPQTNIPLEKGCFIVSVSLGRTIICNLEKSWPQDHLIDRDFSRHNTLTWSPGTVRPKENISPLAFEADLSLTPALGIIITSLLKVKQRPLPGSNAQTPLHERLFKVSERYEGLIVLVSECNPTGEFTGRPSCSDFAAYADFVGFTTALRANVIPYLVPGAEDTLSKWILSLMCRHTPHALVSKRFMSPRETTWEMFLRRAGMNVFAAQALSGALYEEGDTQGLARFLVMPAEERISRYRRLMGGDKILLQSSAALDGRWS